MPVGLLASAATQDEAMGAEIAQSFRRADGSVMDLMRRDLGEQLNDGPIQELIAARIRLIALMNSSEAHRRELTPLAESIEAAISELRKIVNADSMAEGPEVAPKAPKPDLFAGLADLCTAFHADTGIHCSFEVLPEHARFDHRVSDALQRCIRELLVNVRKHARATRVRMASGIDGSGSVFFSIEDNGVGFGSINRLRSRGTDTGVGLWSIERRLRDFDGYTEIRSENGVSVRLVLPARLLLDA